MSNTLKDFYKNKKVFITGHSGFKGSWISIWLQRMGAIVTGYSLETPTQPSLFELAELKNSMHTIINDIRDIDALVDSIKSANPEIIFHMAAQSLVRQSYIDPINTYSTNVMGTVNILEVARNAKDLRAVVIITSDKCYQNNDQKKGYIETDPMGGYDPYSSSKGCSELVVSAYRSSFFNIRDFDGNKTAIASARAGNVIGGGDWARDRLIPDLIRGFLEKEPVIIRNPNATRPWQHVLEPLSGYLLLAQRLYENAKDYAGGWNFGPRQKSSKSVNWISDQSVKLWGDGSKYLIDKDVNPNEANYLKLDSSKAFTELDWNPRWDINIALERTINWYKQIEEQAKNKKNILEACLADISVYETS